MNDTTFHDSIHLRSRLEAQYDGQSHYDSTLPEQHEVAQNSLPPVDGGRSAWMFLTGCFLIELVVWGE